MATSKKNVVRKRPGRPATGQDPVTAIRLSEEMRAEIDAWAEQQNDEPGRSEAIRRLIEIGLTVKTERASKSEDTKQRQSRKQRARQLAGDAVDKMTDTTASAQDQASRKRRLIKGPEEFREARVDLPKAKER
jgi:hypothetical protein